MTQHGAYWLGGLERVPGSDGSDSDVHGHSDGPLPAVLAMERVAIVMRHGARYIDTETQRLRTASMIVLARCKSQTNTN